VKGGCSVEVGLDWWEVAAEGACRWDTDKGVNGGVLVEWEVNLDGRSPVSVVWVWAVAANKICRNGGIRVIITRYFAILRPFLPQF